MKNLFMIMIVITPFITKAQNWVQKGDSLTGTNYFGKSVSISADGSRMVAASQGSVKIYNYNNINNVWDSISEVVSSFVGKVSLSSDGNCFAMTNKNLCMIYENDFGNWTQIGSISFDTTITSISLKNYNSSYRLAIGSKNSKDSSSVMTGVVRIYDYDGLNWNITSSGSGSVGSLFGYLATLNEQGDKLVVASIGKVGVYNSNDFSQIDTSITLNTASSIDLYSNNTKLILAIGVSSDKKVYIYDDGINGGNYIRLEKTFSSSTNFGSSVSITSDYLNKLVLAISNGNDIVIQSVYNNNNLASTWFPVMYISMTSSITSICLSSNGQSLAIGTQINNQVKVFTTETITTSITTNNKLEKGITFNNPTTGSLKIRLGDNYSNVQARVMNVYGQILSTTTENNTDNINLSINEATGYYFVELTADDLRKTLKVLKQ